MILNHVIVNQVVHFYRYSVFFVDAGTNYLYTAHLVKLFLSNAALN